MSPRRRSLGDLFAHALSRQSNLSEAIDAARVFSELSALPTLRSPLRSEEGNPQKTSNFVLLMAKLSGENYSDILAAMEDPENAAGRVLRAWEQSLVAEKGKKRGKVGRPAKGLGPIARSLDNLWASRSDPGKRTEHIASTLEKLGVSYTPDQVRDQARNFHKKKPQ